MLQYNNPSSWGMAYNLWADKLFQYNLFPASVYSMQTSWYAKKFATYGIPLDTRHTYTKSGMLSSSSICRYVELMGFVYRLADLHCRNCY
jgi:hypothetical protein